MVSLYQAKAKPKRQGQQLKMVIERLDYAVNGIAHYQNKIAFVSGALPGEQVLVEITEDKAGYLKGKTRQVLTPSPNRIAPLCPHFDHCGGCQLQYLSAEQQQLAKQQGVDALLQHQLQLTRIPWQPMLSSVSEGYRRKARIGIWFDKKRRQVITGFRQSGAKELAHISHCAVLEPSLQPIFRVLQQVVPLLAQPEAITHAEVMLSAAQPVVIIRHMTSLTSQERAAFINAWPEASWFGEAEADVLAPWQQQGHTLTYSLAQELTLSYAPNDFIQVNARVNQLMIDQALAWLAPKADDTILDLYCGIGNFSLPLAQQAKLVHGIEGLSKMVQQATKNAAANGLDHCQFWQADLHLPWPKAVWNKPIYQKVLLDPARAGAEQAVKEVAKLKPAQILYVSCNPATFARDAKYLLTAGYELQKVSGVDMFPHTAHLELMALFQRHTTR